jgi:hypothetical protein
MKAKSLYKISRNHDNEDTHYRLQGGYGKNLGIYVGNVGEKMGHKRQE